MDIGTFITGVFLPLFGIIILAGLSGEFKDWGRK